MSFQYDSVVLFPSPNFVTGTSASGTLSNPKDNLTFTVGSIYIPPYVYLTLFDAKNYTGLQTTYTSSVLDTTTTTIFTSGNVIQSYIVQYSKVPYYQSSVKPDPTKPVLFYNSPYFNNTGSIIYQQSVGSSTALSLTGTLSIQIQEGTYVTITDDSKTPNTLTFYHNVQRFDVFYTTGFAKITTVTVKTISCPVCDCPVCEKCEKCKISNKFYDFIRSTPFFIILGSSFAVIVLVIYVIYKIIVNKTLQKAAAKK